MIDAKKSDDATRLKLYRQYIYVLEHLHLLDGGLPVADYEYNFEYLKRGYRRSMIESRDELQKKIQELNRSSM